LRPRAPESQFENGWFGIGGTGLFRLLSSIDSIMWNPISDHLSEGPVGNQRRRSTRDPKFLLLLIAILEILNGCSDARDSIHLAKHHHKTLRNAIPGEVPNSR
jgi:hypothetical protein